MWQDFDSLSASQIYHLMTQTLIPRPIAWVLTNTATQDNPKYNLAPFSYFTPISSDPALILFSVGNRSHGVAKDTVRALRSQPYLTLHIASSAQAESLNSSAATLDYGESEIERCGLTLVEQKGFHLPRVDGSPVAYSCKVVDIQEVGNAPQHLVIAQLESVWVDSQAVTVKNDRWVVDATQIDPLCRLGGGQFATLNSPFVINRPQ